MDWYPLAAASTDTMEDYIASDFCDVLDNFFTFEMRKKHPQIPFYDTPQGAIFGALPHKKVQIKRRILEYQAKY
jgi:hypothetical protein